MGTAQRPGLVTARHVPPVVLWLIVLWLWLTVTQEDTDMSDPQYETNLVDHREVEWELDVLLSETNNVLGVHITGFRWIATGLPLERVEADAILASMDDGELQRVLEMQIQRRRDGHDRDAP